jgi:hypothetical protein
MQESCFEEKACGGMTEAAASSVHSGILCYLSLSLSLSPFVGLVNDQNKKG